MNKFFHSTELAGIEGKSSKIKIDSRAQFGTLKIEDINRIENKELKTAVRDIVKNNGGPENIIGKHLNGLRGKIRNNSMYNTLRSVGYKLFPWQMGRKPRNFYKESSNRIDTIRWLILEEGFKNTSDFRSNGFETLIKNYYSNSFSCMLHEADFLFERKNSHIEFLPNFNVQQWKTECKKRWLME